jgi:Kdo2-lipid IVA lauroyltransferase/acyltransferase
MSSEETAAAPPNAYQRELIRPTAARRLKWRLETLVYRVFELGLGVFPLPWLARLGRAAGALTHALLGSRRHIVERNLRIAFAGERTAAERAALAREVFRRSGANLLCSLGTAAKDGRGLAASITVRDEKIFWDAQARGKGVVAVLAHMGNWEALAQWIPRLLPPSVKVANIYRPLNNPIMDGRLLAKRKRDGLKMFSKDDNPLAMAAFLRAGGVLSILSDQRAGKIGELAPLFGRNTSVTPLPAVLARRTGAALIGVSLRTVAPGRWELAFHASDATEPTTGHVMELLERVMRVSPEDVFWMQDRWKVDRSRPHRPPGKLPRGVCAPATKRRRALLWPDAQGRLPAPPAAVPDDVAPESLPRVAGEKAEIFLRRVDAAADLPLDYVVAAAPDAELRQACRKLGLGLINEDAK